MYTPLFKRENGIARMQEKLKGMGFEEFELCYSGSDALIVNVSDNPDIVISLRCDGSIRASVQIPQVLQAIVSEDYGDYEIEILPKLETKGIKEEDEDLFLKEMETAYASRGNVTMGYTAIKRNLSTNLGFLTYRDVNARLRKIPIALDPGAIKKRGNISTQEEDADGKVEVYTTDFFPRCTENYPTLKDQRRVQQEIIDRDPRLQKLLPEGRALPMPETEIISTRGHRNATKPGHSL